MSAALPHSHLHHDSSKSISLTSNDESRVLNELTSLCNHEVGLLENRWLQVGQHQRPPKRLIENVNALSASYQASDLRLRDSVVDEVKLLFQNIRRALRVISIVKEDSNPTPYGYEGLARKATVFIKRLSHDDDLAQSVGGAKRFRKYQKSVKTQQKLREPVCEPEEYDLGFDWYIKKLVCQQDLLNAGRKLQLCVSERKGTGERFFRHLVTRRSTFWVMSFQDKPTYLLELRTRRGRRGGPEFESMFDVGEFDGHDHDEPELPHAVAQNLSRCLNANPASSEVLLRAGVFPAFELGIKDPNEPDVVVNIEGLTYEAWLT
ncbi:MAG: hypothetical protein OXG15_03875 [Gammaproteobacteria bacterium]|nr:hypothetical protein [Gammaproteobacteria bacterium]